MGCGGSTPQPINPAKPIVTEDEDPFDYDIGRNQGYITVMNEQGFDINADTMPINGEDEDIGSLKFVMTFSNFLSSCEKPQIFEYEFIKLIGRGAHGEVYLARNIETGIMYAAKVYDKILLSKCQIGETEIPLERMLREIHVMSLLSSEFCIQLIEVLDDEPTHSVIVVMSLADEGELLPESNHTDPIPEPEAKRLFKQIALGLQFIHNRGIIHRDIKPQNILKCSNGRVQIADFSASSIIPSNGDDTLEDTEGTPMFYSPEECTGDPYKGKPSDIWSLGVTLYDMIYGHLPFYADEEDGVFLSHFYKISQMIQNDPIIFDENADVSPELLDLLHHILEKDPTKRYTISQVLEHPWIRDVAVC